MRHEHITGQPDPRKVSELQEICTDNSAAMFETIHDGRREGTLPKQQHFENFDLLNSKSRYLDKEKVQKFFFSNSQS